MSRTIGLGVDVDMWVEEGKIHYNKYLYPEVANAFNEISSISVGEITEKLDKTDLLKWHRYYNLDEYTPFYEFWIIKYKDSRRKRTKVIEGDTHPNMWWEFISIISEVVGSIR